MSDPWADKAPDTQFRMFWGGEWRPVYRMLDAGGTPTTLPLRAVAVVLYAPNDKGSYVTTTVGPGDVLTNHDHTPKNWEEID